jgi:5'-deoxynucleotidase YfbR-like HD superfamily hydrolase
MTDIRTTWSATFTRRWHSNPDMGHTVDPVGGHSARVALILLHCWPNASRDLIMAALMHDLAESVTGDIPPAAKEMFPTFSLMERHVAAANGWHIELPPEDEARLKFADRLDAFMWADHHNKAHGDEWEDGREWLIYAAERMGIMDKVRDVL